MIPNTIQLYRDGPSRRSRAKCCRRAISANEGGCFRRTIGGARNRLESGEDRRPTGAVGNVGGGLTWARVGGGRSLDLARSHGPMAVLSVRARSAYDHWARPVQLRDLRHVGIPTVTARSVSPPSEGGRDVYSLGHRSRSRILDYAGAGSNRIVGEVVGFRRWGRLLRRPDFSRGEEPMFDPRTDSRIARSPSALRTEESGFRSPRIARWGIFSIQVAIKKGSPQALGSRRGACRDPMKRGAPPSARETPLPTRPFPQMPSRREIILGRSITFQPPRGKHRASACAIVYRAVSEWRIPYGRRGDQGASFLSPMRGPSRSDRARVIRFGNISRRNSQWGFWLPHRPGTETWPSNPEN